MPNRMFGTAGIRGITNRDITPELALKIGIVAGDWLADACDSRKPSAAVGHDTRYGSEILARAAASGLAAAGVHVQFYGPVPTGVLSLNLRKTGQDGAILITGSHTGPDRNGIIVLASDGSYAPRSVTDILEKRYHALPDRLRHVPPEHMGRIEEVFHPYETYVSEIVNLIDVRALRQRKFKVLIDPANGPASYVAMELFQWFGCEVELLNYDPAPVPGRPSEPRADTVTEAAGLVKRLGCDLGICTDVDADRALFIDHEGSAVSEDTIGAILALHELKAGDTCVTPITSSGSIETICRNREAKLEYCGVGAPATAEAIRTFNAAFAYEESGKYYFPRQNIWADGLFSGGKLLEMMLRRNLSLKDLAADMPRFHQVKSKIEVADESARISAMARIAARLDKELVDGRVRDVRIDGFKRVYTDHTWLLFRASATEPVIRIYSDSPDKARAEELVRQGRRILEDVLK